MASPCSGETLPPYKRVSKAPSPPTPEVSKPVTRKIRPIYQVKVTKDGRILTKKSDKPWKQLDNPWWLRKHPGWQSAVERFARDFGLVPSIPHLLASILMPKPAEEEHNLARKKVYRKLARWAGFKGREPLPGYIMDAVRDVYPDPNEEYMGYLDA